MISPGRATKAPKRVRWGLLSASRPPKKFPTLKAVRKMLMRLPQTKMDDPNCGASTRLPTISKAMRMAPPKTTMSLSICCHPNPIIS